MSYAERVGGIFYSVYILQGNIKFVFRGRRYFKFKE